jgi:hypothetical protein
MIDFSLENELTNRNYRKLTNSNKYYNFNDNELEQEIQNCWIYSKQNNECAMISLDHNIVNDSWVLSFPIKSSNVNYKLTMDTKEEVTKYIKFMLNENALE